MTIEFHINETDVTVDSLKEHKIVSEGKEILYGEPCIGVISPENTSSELRYCIYDEKFLTSNGTEPETIPSGLKGQVAVRGSGVFQLTVSFPSSFVAFAMVRSAI